MLNGDAAIVNGYRFKVSSNTLSLYLALQTIKQMPVYSIFIIVRRIPVKRSYLKRYFTYIIQCCISCCLSKVSWL